MIPVHLRLAGFLSYRDPAELDFTRFELACISGPNGAGKSTLLDAITWALFGQARRRDDSLVNLQSDVAEVAFVFQYEGTEYRVLRSLRRGKTGLLELQARPTGLDVADETGWRAITERTQRETQGRIEQILRLDYETFVNASFFLQGKADLFAQQTPAKRKDVLGNILGMEAWETYRARVADVRRRHEATLDSVDGRLGEIGMELSEEDQRQQRLTELEAQLSRMVRARALQASTHDSARKAHAALEQQRLLLAEQANSLDRARSDLAGLQSRFEDRQRARVESTQIVGHAQEIELAYKSWRQAILDLERWEVIARGFRDQEKLRAPLLQEIASEEARLRQEQALLTSRHERLQERFATAAQLQSELDMAVEVLAQTEALILERDRLQAELATMRESIAGKTAENQALRQKMDEIKDRMLTLEAASGASCPLCGQPLSAAHRKSTIERLQAEGRQLGDQYRLNSAAAQELKSTAEQTEARLTTLAGMDARRLEQTQSRTQLTERLAAIQFELREWETEGRRRLEELGRLLTGAAFASMVRAQLAVVDAGLAKLGYDAAAHDMTRLRESSQRGAERSYADLQAARAALEPLENEIRSLETQIGQRAREVAAQESEVEAAQAALNRLAADLPPLAQLEQALFELQEQENQLNQEVGAARQKVLVLATLRQRGAQLQSERQSLALSIGRLKTLENAFGKDGVPALLVEQALPEVESRANEILDRLSDGRMSVHFETQSPYRDRKREDLRETLDIKISDGAGMRDYEMYSGGEAFRINFAIRLALSQVLAGRKGARLQTLVIDEGFGSQDTQGRQRLIETINLVRHDFAKILLISHLDDLKDAFPTRIEVEKHERGSTLRVA